MCTDQHDAVGVQLAHYIQSDISIIQTGQRAAQRICHNLAHFLDIIIWVIGTVSRTQHNYIFLFGCAGVIVVDSTAF